MGSRPGALWSRSRWKLGETFSGFEFPGLEAMALGETHRDFLKAHAVMPDDGTLSEFEYETYIEIFEILRKDPEEDMIARLVNSMTDHSPTAFGQMLMDVVASLGPAGASAQLCDAIATKRPELVSWAADCAFDQGSDLVLNRLMDLVLSPEFKADWQEHDVATIVTAIRILLTGSARDTVTELRVDELARFIEYLLSRRTPKALRRSLIEHLNVLAIDLGNAEAKRVLGVLGES